MEPKVLSTEEIDADERAIQSDYGLFEDWKPDERIMQYIATVRAKEEEKQSYIRVAERLQTAYNEAVAVIEQIYNVAGDSYVDDYVQTHQMAEDFLAKHKEAREE